MKIAALALLLALQAKGAPAPSSVTASCFLLYEVGVGEVRRRPSEICTTRLLPASTFKVPHALAALDAGVLSGPDEMMKYDGAPTSIEAWRRDHTLASAMRDSVLWYFQRVAERLGAAREREYLKKFDYGNADPTSGLTTFWLGGSLQISPEEQLRFMRRLYAGDLPASPAATRTVRQLLVHAAGARDECRRPAPVCRPMALWHHCQRQDGKRHGSWRQARSLAGGARGARTAFVGLCEHGRGRQRHPRARRSQSGRIRPPRRGSASLMALRVGPSSIAVDPCARPAAEG
jgi:beta-lactamase class D